MGKSLQESGVCTATSSGIVINPLGADLFNRSSNNNSSREYKGRLDNQMENRSYYEKDKPSSRIH